MITSYNVVSEDGFIAEENGEENFIPDEIWNDFLTLCNNYSYLIIGGNTYKTIQSYEEKMIEEFEKLSIQKIIITRDTNFQAKSIYKIVNSIDTIKSLSGNILLSSGPKLNNALLKENLIDKIIRNIIPIKIEKGIKTFDVEPKLILESTININNHELYLYNIEK